MRQNRVTPFGAIVAVPERGTFLGNRGVLHDEAGRIKRSWQVKRWIVCVLEYKGRRRTVMAPNRYTELFFLDEATALAAGHRPCSECRHARFLEFREAWAAGNGVAGSAAAIKAAMIDDRLHAERLGPDRSQRTFQANLDTLPDGVFVILEGRDDQPRLIRNDSLLVWSPGGYLDREPRREGTAVTVLTPISMVRAIRAGYPPEVHPTADACQ